MELTPRQKAFLDEVIRLYHSTGEAVHYSTVADRMGVGRTTAYEMLRLLERKGYLSAHYVLEEGSGPGRSTVVFTPIAGASDPEWEGVRSRILNALSHGEIAEQELLREILNRLPSSRSPLAYCAQVITALLLNLGEELRSRLGEHELIQALLANNLPDQPSLNLLPGFALGLSFRERRERANRELRARLVEYTQEYQRRLARLDAQSRILLQEFLRKLVVLAQSPSHGGEA